LLISVITVNYNNSLGLRETIQSVIGQTYSDIEYIVVDGGSTDRSLAVIEEHTAGISWWVSEKDNGVYDAMNKGIARANGEYLLFLNSGDYFYSKKSLEIFAAQNHDADIVYGDLQVITVDKNWVKPYPVKLSFRYFLNDTLPHPSSFIRRELFSRCGMYDTGFRIVADWAFFIKAICKDDASYKHIDEVISSFRYDGMSSKPENQPIIAAEKDAYLQAEFPMFIDDYLETESMLKKHSRLQHSRVRKLLARFFKQLDI
jgi:glycosyltransferase involved in cell wall biosynthesis